MFALRQAAGLESKYLRVSVVWETILLLFTSSNKSLATEISRAAAWWRVKARINDTEGIFGEGGNERTGIV